MAQIVTVSIVLVLLLMINSASVALSNTLKGFRVDLNHIHAQGKFTDLQHHLLAAQKSMQRKATLLNKMSSPSGSDTTGIQLQAHQSDALYQIDLAIGTPPVPFTAIVDISDDLTWIQCQPCTRCSYQPEQLYDPSKSSSFSKIPCNNSLCQALLIRKCTPDCTYSGYISGDTEGILATETLAFQTVDGKQTSFSNIGFGCSHTSNTENAAGVVGLNRRPLSLINQLSVSRFSHCLAPFRDSKSSTLVLGSLANLNESSSVPLVQSDLGFYALAWDGITVGETRFPVPEIECEAGGDGFRGLVMDTSSPYGFLVKSAFGFVKQELIAQMKLPILSPLLTNSELCFLLPSNSTVQAPKLIFHFNGVDLELPVNNYMIHDPSTSVLCFAMLVNECYSSFGNFQLQNMHVVYDLIEDKVSISPAQCDRL